MNGMPYHSTGITRHVTSGYLRFHPMLTISLFVVALLSAMLPVVALNSLNLYVQAAKEGAAGQSGGYTYQISGGSNDVAEELRQQVQNGKDHRRQIHTRISRPHLRQRLFTKHHRRHNFPNRPLTIWHAHRRASAVAKKRNLPVSGRS
mgnify:CR=1 FL=1